MASKTALLIGTWNEGLFTVEVGGESARQEIAHTTVRGLAADGRGGALAIAGGHSLQRRAPGGEWVTLAVSECELSCCMTVGGTIYVGTEDARMLRLSGASGVLDPLESFDEVAGRDTWFAGSAIVNGQRLGPPLGVRSVAANADGTVLLANVHVGGIPRSLDGGRTWEPTIDIHSDVHEARGHPTNPDVVAAASAVGLCISRDAGATWTIERDGLHAAHCSAIAFSGEDVLISASTDPFSAQGKVYRLSLKQGGRIEPVENGLPEWTSGKVDTGCMDTRGPMIVVVDTGGNLYLSDNFGGVWSLWSSGLPTPSGVLIV